MADMAPSLQQRLQGAWDNVNAAVLAQPSPFDPHAHLSNFLESLARRSSSPPHDHSGFPLHFPFPFPFPFARLFLNREIKSRSSNTSESLIGSSLHRHNPVRLVEEGSQSLKRGLPRSEEERIRGVDGTRSHEEEHIHGVDGTRSHEEEYIHGVDGTRSHGNPISIPTELQLLQMQLETSALGLSVPVSKEVLGRATWTFLHTLAAQFPEKPTRQQQRDAKELMAILSRLYPCKECADHFKEVLKVNPVQAGSGVELAQWMCTVHNIVNRSLGKSLFPCQRVDARWGAMDCDEGACSLQGRMH